MSTQFFSPGMTRDQIKDEYRRLAKIHHPDLGGNTATMQALNAAYTYAIDHATRDEMPGRSEASYTHQAATNETIRAKMEEAVRIMRQYPQLTIEVCGYWLWVHGTAKGDPAIPALKAAGYRWAHNKALWYFATIPSGQHGKAWSMDHIRAEHGSEYVARQAQAEKATASLG